MSDITAPLPQGGAVAFHLPTIFPPTCPGQLRIGCWVKSGVWYPGWPNRMDPALAQVEVELTARRTQVAFQEGGAWPV